MDVVCVARRIGDHFAPCSAVLGLIPTPHVRLASDERQDRHEGDDRQEAQQDIADGETKAGGRHCGGGVCVHMFTIDCV
jgi:hypothetical protein